MYNPDAGSLAANVDAVQQLNDAGIAVFVWTVNSAAQWRQLLAALDAEDWDALESKLVAHVADADVVAALVAEIEVLAAG